MKNAIYLLISIIFLTQVSHAGTVVLTGTCSGNLAPGNVLNFALFNNGTDTAYSLLVSPIIQNASPAENTYSISSLPPRVSITTHIGLLNITGRGSYVSALILNYQQGQQTFTALFPCIINFSNSTNSTLRIFHSSQVNSSNIAKIEVNVTNGSNNNLSTIVSMFVPPTFTNLSSSSYLIALKPFQTKSLFFTYALPLGQVNYTTAIAASYVFGGLHYASLATLAVSNYIPPTKANSQNYLFIGVIVIVVLLLLLIVRSIIRRRKRSVNQPNTVQ